MENAYLLVGYYKKGRAWTSPQIAKIRQIENKSVSVQPGVLVFLLVPPVGELFCKEQKGMNSWHKNAGWCLGLALRCQKKPNTGDPHQRSTVPSTTDPGHLVKFAASVLDRWPD